MGKKDDKKSKKSFKTVLRRYWYWFATIPVLFVVSFVWLYFIGVFDSVNAIVIRTSTPDAIEMPVESMYHMVVTSDSGETPVFSSNHPSIVEVTEDGYLISHREGSAVITASFGKRRHEVAVTVTALSTVWYLMPGDAFTRSDVFAAFPSISGLSGIQVSGNGFLKTEFPEGGDEKYVVQEGFSEGVAPVYIYATALGWEGDTLKEETKATVTLWMVPTAEEKEKKMDAYQKYIFDGETVDVKLDGAEETMTVECGVIYDLRPKFLKDGFVKFYVDGNFEDDFPIRMEQTGALTVDAMIDEFFVVAVADNEEFYRYKIKANPRISNLTLSVGQEILMEDYYKDIPIDVARFSSTSSKLQPLYGDEGDFIGFKALEVTDMGVYIDCSSYIDKDYIGFRFNVSINDDPLPEEP